MMHSEDKLTPKVLILLAITVIGTLMFLPVRIQSAETQTRIDYLGTVPLKPGAM